MAFGNIWGVTVSIGVLLAFAAFLVKRASGRLFVCTSGVAGVGAYVFAISLNSGHTVAVAAAWTIASGFLIGTAFGYLVGGMPPDGSVLLSLVIIEVIKRFAYYAESLTGGAYGLVLNAPAMPSIQHGFMLGLLVCVAGGSGVALWFRSSRGALWRVAGEDNRAALLLGANPTAILVAASAIGGMLAASAGILHCISYQYIHPDDYGASIGIAALAVALAAPVRHSVMWLAVIGIFAFGLRDGLRLWEVGGSIRFAVFQVVVGVVLLLIAFRALRDVRR